MKAVVDRRWGSSAVPIGGSGRRGSRAACPPGAASTGGRWPADEAVNSPVPGVYTPYSTVAIASGSKYWILRFSLRSAVPAGPRPPGRSARSALRIRPMMTARRQSRPGHALPTRRDPRRASGDAGGARGGDGGGGVNVPAGWEHVAYQSPPTARGTGDVSMVGHATRSAERDSRRGHLRDQSYDGHTMGWSRPGGDRGAAWRRGTAGGARRRAASAESLFQLRMWKTGRARPATSPGSPPGSRRAAALRAEHVAAGQQAAGAGPRLQPDALGGHLRPA